MPLLGSQAARIRCQQNFLSRRRPDSYLEAYISLNSFVYCPLHTQYYNSFDNRSILDTPTWRASADWGRKLGYDEKRLDLLNRRAANALKEMLWGSVMIISGAVGPRSQFAQPLSPYTLHAQMLVTL
jgi:S-methylmethionine-dependent homocysteine/selenocysteine methylase